MALCPLSLPTLTDNEKIGAITKVPNERFTQQAILKQQEYADRGSGTGDVRSGHLFSFWSGRATRGRSTHIGSCRGVRRPRPGKKPAGCIHREPLSGLFLVIPDVECGIKLSATTSENAGLESNGVRYS